MNQGTPVVELLLGTVPLIASVLIHGVGMGVVQHTFETRGLPKYRAGKRAGLVFAAMIVLMLVTHLAEIFMWSVALVGIDAIAGFRDAFYYVAGTYTTLGYGEGTLPKEWRGVGPLISIPAPFAF